MAYTPEEINAVWRKCNERCAFGNRKKVLLSNYDRTWQIGYAKPLLQGGVDNILNRLVVCNKHQQQKGDKTRQEFEQWLELNMREKPCFPEGV